MSHRVIEIAGRKVGDGYPPIISAECGINHNGDMVLAKEMIAAAKEAGCDAVKFQNYRTADFVKNKHEIYDNGHGFRESKWTMFQRCELVYDDLAMLKEEADRLGLIFHSTPTSREGVDDLVMLGVPVLKNGADYFSNITLSEYMIESGIQTVFSTAEGFGEWPKLMDIYDKSKQKPIVLHTVREYPAKDWDKKRFERIKWVLHDYIVGYSDHTIGIDAAVEVVKLGACWVEAHFCLDKNGPGPDAWFSKDAKEMAELVKEIRNA